jgi:NhaA family Na+:H+ antiporter
MKTRGSPLRRVIKPFVQFFELEASGSVLLVVATLAALICANGGLASDYFGWLSGNTTLLLGPLSETLSRQGWINDGLMAVFFFVVGLEIKQEILSGELSTWKQASLPIAAALGGMLVPVLLYVGANIGTSTVNGWAVPMATDIAFALGVLKLFGKRAPLALKVFLAALAIVDDIGAVLVIALFYTEKLHIEYLAWACGVILLLIALARFRLRSVTVFLIGGFVLWWLFHHSGIHATLAGVVTAFLVPGTSREPGDTTRPTPLEVAMRVFHPIVAFAIVPLFAFANAGVSFEKLSISEMFTSKAPLGIALGLFIGKPLGIVGATWLMVRTGAAKLQPSLAMSHILGAGLLGGIGFTMAIFVSRLAFTEQELPAVKLSVLVTSLVAALAGSLVLFKCPAGIADAGNMS